MKTTDKQTTDQLILALVSAAEALHHSGWTKQAGDLKHWAWKLETAALELRRTRRTTAAGAPR